MNARRSLILSLPALALGASLLLTGCDSQSNTSTTPAANSEHAVTAVEISDSAAGETTTKVLDQLNSTSKASASAWEGTFSAELEKSLTPKQLVEIFNNKYRELGPFTPTSFEETGNTAVTRIVGSDGVSFDLVVALDESGELLSGIHFKSVAS